MIQERKHLRTSDQYNRFKFLNNNGTGEISGSHGGEYKDDLTSGMLRRVVW
jgi:hypothetical protein